MPTRLLQVQMYKHTGLQLYETQKRLDIKTHRLHRTRTLTFPSFLKQNLVHNINKTCNIYITVRGYFYFPHPDNHNLMHRCTHTADNL